jgi:hypothetical protein
MDSRPDEAAQETSEFYAIDAETGEQYSHPPPPRYA